MTHNQLDADCNYQELLGITDSDDEEMYIRKMKLSNKRKGLNMNRSQDDKLNRILAMQDRKLNVGMKVVNKSKRL